MGVDCVYFNHAEEEFPECDIQYYSKCPLKDDEGEEKFCPRQLTQEEAEYEEAEQLFNSEQLYKAQLCSFRGTNSNAKSRQDEKLKKRTPSLLHIYE